MDENGNFIPHSNGTVIPEWGGIGDPNQGCYAGLPGKIFARVLEELWTEVSPSGAYWNPTRVISDKRLTAFATDTSTYKFDSIAGKEVLVDVTLLFRRAFIKLMTQKNWDIPDIVMEHKQIRLYVP